MDAMAKSRIKPALGGFFRSGKRIVDIHKGRSSRVTPGKCGRVGCTGRNFVKKRNELRQDTLLMVMDLVKVRLFKIRDSLGSDVAIA